LLDLIHLTAHYIAIINFSSLIIFFLNFSMSFQFGAKALYSNLTSLEFEGNRAIETAPSISLFFNILKLDVLIVFII